MDSPQRGLADGPEAVLPLEPLLRALQSEHLALGVDARLAVGRLLERWDGAGGLPVLRDALAAALARNVEEVALIRAAFDRIYGPPPAPVVPESPTVARRVWRRRWTLRAAAATALVAAAGLAVPWAGYHGSATCPRTRGVCQQGCEPGCAGNEIIKRCGDPDGDGCFTWQPEVCPEGTACRDGACLATSDARRPADGQRTAGVPSPPTLPGLPPTVPREDPAELLAPAVLGFLGVLWALLRRGRRLRGAAQARAVGRGAIAALPGPMDWSLPADLLPGPTAESLDDLGAAMADQQDARGHPDDLDVELTLAATLAAGGVPTLVPRAVRRPCPLVVLEDRHDELATWRGVVSDLVAGLSARGVWVEHLHFVADAGRIVRPQGGEAQLLEDLLRDRADAPLLLVTTGVGLVDPVTRRRAAWVERLCGHARAAILHPEPDDRLWRWPFRELPHPILPLTDAGLEQAGRALARRPVDRLAAARVSRPPSVVRLDIERLGWIASLLPRREAALLEHLRRRFLPHVPPAAVPLALDAPLPATAPGVGPSESAVRQAILAVLDRARPELGSRGALRWRLDRALQAVHLPDGREAALEELEGLAAGPLAVEVEDALTRLCEEAEGATRRAVGPTAAQLHRRSAREARHGALRLEGRVLAPRAAHVLVALAAGAVVLGACFWAFPQPRPAEIQDYALALGPQGTAGFTLLVTPPRRERPNRPPQEFEIYRGTEVIRTAAGLTAAGPQRFLLSADQREAWFRIRGIQRNGRPVVSNPVWVPAAIEEPARPDEPDEPDGPGEPDVADVPAGPDKSAPTAETFALTEELSMLPEPTPEPETETRRTPGTKRQPGKITIRPKPIPRIVITTAEVDIAGGLDKEIIERYVLTKMGQIRWCYKNELQKRPGLEGKITIEFIIAPTGKVLSAKVAQSTMGDRAVESCIIQKVAMWRFPASKQGAAAKVRYPFVFRAADEPRLGPARLKVPVRRPGDDQD